jgi:hypothetical protein
LDFLDFFLPPTEGGLQKPNVFLHPSHGAGVGTGGGIGTGGLNEAGGSVVVCPEELPNPNKPSPPFICFCRFCVLFLRETVRFVFLGISINIYIHTSYIFSDL